MKTSARNICLNFLPHGKILEKPLFGVVLVFYQRKSTRKILSVKTCIICKGIFRTLSSNYHRAFFTKETLFSLSEESNRGVEKICKTHRKNLSRIFISHKCIFAFLQNFKNTFLRKKNTSGWLLLSRQLVLQKSFPVDVPLSSKYPIPFICNTNQLTSFYLIQYFTETFFPNRLLKPGFQ